MLNINAKETSLPVFIPEASGLMAEVNRQITPADQWEVVDQATSELATAEVRNIKAIGKAFDDKRKELVGPLNDTVKKINDLFKPAIEHCASEEQKLKSKLLTYAEAERKKAEEAQRIAEQAARAAREQAEREAAALAAKAREESDRLAAEAKAAAEAGNAEQAAALAMQATQTVQAAQEQAAQAVAVASVATVTPISAPVTKGLSTRKNYKARVTDKAALVKWIVNERPELLSLIDINETALNAQAKSLEENLKWPGVEVFNQPIAAVR